MRLPVCIAHLEGWGCSQFYAPYSTWWTYAYPPSQYTVPEYLKLGQMFSTKSLWTCSDI